MAGFKKTFFSSCELAIILVPTGAEVIELGLLNKTAHQVNEEVNLNDLSKLEKIYEKILEKLFFK